MAIRFSRSASRHAIAADRARFVVDNCSCPLFPPGHGDRDLVVFLGPDARGVPLEVIAVELDDGDLLVIHAMKLRERFRNDYARVMRCLEQ